MRLPFLAGMLLLLLFVSDALVLGGQPAERRIGLPPVHGAAPRPVAGPRPEAGSDAEPVAPAIARVREIPSDTLSDIAVADYREAGSVIYYNPVALRRLGPLLSAYFMAHERGHIQLRHTRANALLAGRTALDSVLQSRELAADCYAAKRLGRENRAAVMAAARFLSRLGTVRYDAAHPPGAQRAATILSCLPEGAQSADTSLVHAVGPRA